MSDVIERYKRNGYTVTIHYDMDGGESANPRDCDGNFLFLGFPHRSYKIGDEELDPEKGFTCPDCDGTGCQGTGMPDDAEDCPTCEGDGSVYPQNLAELIAMVKAEYKANLVLPVGMIDHSGVSYYIGGGAHPHDPGGWDSGTCGLILDTPEALEVRGFPTPLTEEWLREGMASEIKEYSKWANGEVYGYVITDRNGDEVDSCWGFLGFDFVQASANQGADAMDAQPELLYDVRLTKQEIDDIVDRLGNQHEAHELSGVAKLAAIDTEEDE